MITQGKWELSKFNNDGECSVFVADAHGGVDCYIAQIAGGLGRVNDDDRCYESEANAELIAAAPETAAQRDALLVACKNMVHAHEYAQTDEEIDDAVATIRAAIALCEADGLVAPAEGGRPCGR